MADVVTNNAPAREKKRRLIINIRQTSDKDGDIHRLNGIVAVLRDYPGRDEVGLNILNGGEAIPLKLPKIQTEFGPELKARLSALVGEDGFRLVTEE